MAYEIVKRLELVGKTTLLEKLEAGVKAKEGKKGKLHQVFKESYDFKECFNQNFIIQKSDYMHKNPVCLNVLHLVSVLYVLRTQH